MSKNIVIFSDGTASKGGKGNPTNVYKLFNMVENRTEKQVVFYDPGLGTDWRSILGLAFGTGFGANILDCYLEIHHQFQAGDQIYLFGFSRGATTVRSLAGFIEMFGILPRSRPELIREAFRLYKMKNAKKREAAVTKFLKSHHTMWTMVKFVGVWDTVAALGLPGKKSSLLVENYVKQPIRDLSLPNCIEYARHAISIDEDRKSFLPVIWDKSERGPEDRLKQVWFCGSHTDIGGGYDDDRLSRIPLMWMLQEAFEKGLRLYPKANQLEGLKQASEEDINGHIHPEREGIGKLYSLGVRYWNFEKFGQLKVHESVFQRHLGKNNEAGTKYEAWILAEGLRNKLVIEPWNLDLDLGETKIRARKKQATQSTSAEPPKPQGNR